MNPARLPDPAVVVLAGAAGSGKSHWAATRYRPVEIVASDTLRSIVGSGPADLEATAEAFILLDQIVAARTKRSLTTVIDTLGLDPDRRDRYRQLAHSCGLPAVLVIINAPAALARQRNRDRDRPVPALVITEQLRRVKELLRTAEDEGWDQVVVIDNPADGEAGATFPARTDDH
jgi:predicted kinase